MIGDEVNIAARLEQLNKKFGTQVLVGENTYQAAQSKFNFSHVGNLRLKGKERTVDLYSVSQGE